MKEATEQLLKLAGFGADVINALKAETLPEDFDIKEVEKAHRQKRLELIKNDSEFMKELKQKHNAEQFPAIVKPLLSQIKKTGMFTDDQWTGLIEDGQKFPDLKRAITQMEANIKQAGTSNVDEKMAEIFKLKKEIESSKETWENEKNQIVTGYETKIKTGQIKRHFSKVINSLDLVIDPEGANDSLYSHVSNNYLLELTDNGDIEILNKDGSKVNNGNEFLKLKDIVTAKADEWKFIKKSNGGGGDGGKGGNNGGHNNNPPPANGKLTGRAAEMEARLKNKK